MEELKFKMEKERLQDKLQKQDFQNHAEGQFEPITKSVRGTARNI